MLNDTLHSKVRIPAFEQPFGSTRVPAILNKATTAVVVGRWDCGTELTAQLVALFHGPETMVSRGWSWQDAVEEASEAQRFHEEHPDLEDRIMCRYGECDESCHHEPLLSDAVYAEAVHAAAEAEWLCEVHPDPVERALHHRGECDGSCVPFWRR